jgi:hypothetical protein
MKKIVTPLFILLTIIGLVMAQAQTANAQKMLRHVVLFKFKEGTSQADIDKIVAGFKELPKKIHTIKGFEWGVNNSPEKINDGLTHAFIVTFSSEKDRNDYLVDPIHKAFVDVLKPHLEKPLVVDYWVEK